MLHPMLHAQVFVRDASYRKENLYCVCALRTGLIVQVGGPASSVAREPFPELFQKRLPDFPRSEGQQQAGSCRVDLSPVAASDFWQMDGLGAGGRFTGPPLPPLDITPSAPSLSDRQNSSALGKVSDPGFLLHLGGLCESVTCPAGGMGCILAWSRCLFVCATLCDMWDLSSPTGIKCMPPALETLSLNQ